MFHTIKQLSYMSLASLLFGFSSQACDRQIKDDDKGNMLGFNKSFAQLSINPNKTQLDALTAEIAALKTSIAHSHEQVNLYQLYGAYNKFSEELLPQYDEEIWDQMAQRLQADRWPSQQHSYEVVGAHLFFPTQQLHQWRETIYTEYLIGRRDMLWAYTFAASYQHPLGYFYLGERFFEINNISVSENIDKAPYHWFFQQAFKDLRQCMNHNDVIYAVGKGLTSLYDSIPNHFQANRVALHQTGTDLKNRLEVLNLRERCIESYSGTPKPSINEFVELIDQDCYPAYLKAIEIAEERREISRAQDLLEQAIAAGYAPAFIYKGNQHLKKKEYDTARQWFYKAGQAGLAQGYIRWGLKLVGYGIYSDWDLIRKATSEERLEAAECFRLAGKMYDPFGYECLGDLYYKQSVMAVAVQEKAELKGKAVYAWLKGCELGWQGCYDEMTLVDRKLTNKIIEDAVDGKRPSWDLAAEFILFLRDDCK